MRGHDDEFVKEPVDTHDRTGKRDRDLVGSNHFGGDGIARGAEFIADRGVQSGIHQARHRKGYVIGREWRAVGKMNAVTEFESNLLAVGRNLPRLGEFGLEFLRMAVDARENASGEVADGERRVVIDQKRVEGLGLGAQAETQFTAVLREGGEREKEQGTQER